MKKIRHIKKICLTTLIVTVTIIGILLIVVSGLLHSNLPKQWLQGRLMSLGDVQASIEAVDIRWNGRTTIQELSLSQPGQTTPLFKVKTIELSHTPLLRLLLTRRFDLTTLNMAEPQLHLQQDPTGSWNVQALAAHFPGNDNNIKTQRPLRSLPEIEISDALITVSDTTGTKMNFAKSHFQGKSTGTGAWTFHGELGSHLTLEGRVELSKTLDHTVLIKYTGDDKQPLSLFGLDLTHLRGNGHWNGQLASSGLTGTLRISKLGTDTVSGTALLTLRADLQSMVATLQQGTWQFKAEPNQIIQADAGRLEWHRQGERLALTQTSITGFGGQLMLDLNLPLAKPLETTAKMSLQDLELSQLSKVLPVLQGLEGNASGILTTQIADPASQPPEPLAVSMDLTINNGSYKQAQLSKVEATGYVGPKRWIVDQSRVDCLQGHARFWTRTSQHQNEQLTYIHTDFNDIDLKQVLRTLGVDTQKAVGKAAGKGMVVIQSSSGMTGEIALTLRQADLMQTSVVGLLYNTLNLRLLGTDHPTGEGQGTLQLEGKTLRLSRFRYFNRGMELRGSVNMKDITLGEQSPIDGYVMATTRPLKGQKLPGLADLDRLLSSLQKNVVTVTIHNTMGEPRVKVVPFAQVQTALKGLLWNQLNNRQ